MKKKDTSSKNSCIESAQSRRDAPFGNDTCDDTRDDQRARQIMVRLESGYVLLSPEQWAQLCATS